MREKRRAEARVCWTPGQNLPKRQRPLKTGGCAVADSSRLPGRQGWTGWTGETASRLRDYGPSITSSHSAPHASRKGKTTRLLPGTVPQCPLPYPRSPAPHSRLLISVAELKPGTAVVFGNRTSLPSTTRGHPTAPCWCGCASAVFALPTCGVRIVLAGRAADRP